MYIVWTPMESIILYNTCNHTWNSTFANIENHWFPLGLRMLSESIVPCDSVHWKLQETDGVGWCLQLQVYYCLPFGIDYHLDFSWCSCCWELSTRFGCYRKHLASHLKKWFVSPYHGCCYFIPFRTWHLVQEKEKPTSSGWSKYGYRQEGKQSKGRWHRWHVVETMMAQL